MNKLLRILAVLGLLGSMALTFLPATVRADPTLNIVGYFWGNDPDSQINNVEYDKYTNILYCQVKVASATNPTLLFSSGNASGLASVATKVHAAGGKISICVIGGNWIEGSSPVPLTNIMANSSYRNTLASNLATMVSTYNLDGVDIDWEDDNVVAANYASFLGVLRGDLGGSATISVTGAAEWDNPSNQWFTPTTVTNYVDFVNLMMYDIHPFPEHSLLADVETYTQEWLVAGYRRELDNGLFIG